MSSTLERLDDPVYGDSFTVEGDVMEQDGNRPSLFVSAATIHVSFKLHRADETALWELDSDSDPTYFSFVGDYGYIVDVPAVDVMTYLLPETAYYVRVWLVFDDGSVRSHLRDRLIFRLA